MKIVVNLDGVKDTLTNIAERNNSRAGQPTDAVGGMFKIVGDILALLFAACELGLSIAVDIREIRAILEKRDA